MAKEKSNGTALATITPEQYPALVQGKSVLETIRHNMGGEEVSPNELNKIRVPAGGATSWTVTNAGEEEVVKALDGIIVHISRRRAYWASPDPTGDPPACSSADCLVGLGTPGGPCNECPLNAFGSAVRNTGENGRGKACKETKLIFLLRPGLLLPDVVVIPAGSLRSIKTYQLTLGAPYWSVVTRLELTKTTNKDGIAFAQVKARKLDVLPQEAAESIRAYAQALDAVFSSVQVDQDDTDAGNGTQEY